MSCIGDYKWRKSAIVRPLRRSSAGAAAPGAADAALAFGVLRLGQPGLHRIFSHVLPRLLPRGHFSCFCPGQPVAKLLERLVGATGFEPATPRPPVWCATRLRHAPTLTARRPGRMADPFNSGRNAPDGGYWCAINALRYSGRACGLQRACRRPGSPERLAQAIAQSFQFGQDRAQLPAERIARLFL